MLRVARSAPGGRRVRWRPADALDLPFPDRSFDCVTSAYLVRNVADLRRAFSEQARVVRPGGRVVCLETVPPPHGLPSPLVLFYLHWVLPRLGALIVGDRPAYRYLTDSTIDFLSPEALADRMGDVGLTVQSIETHMFGTQAILAAVRPR
jgi:demethylmenaquinone methyltransferase/2-methoxy-6-polyprenyl-1,4-benzoquinol methylase